MKHKLLITLTLLVSLASTLAAQSKLAVFPKPYMVAYHEVCITVAQELLIEQTKEVDMNNYLNMQIMYVPEIGMTNDSTLVFEIKNAILKKVPDNELFLLRAVDDGTDGDGNPQGTANDGMADHYTMIAKMTDIITGTNDGYTTVKFQLTDNISATDTIVMSTEEETLLSPDIIVNEGLSTGSKVTLQVIDARDDNAQPLSTPTTQPFDLIKIIPGLSMITTSAISIINVNEERKHFDETAYGRGTTDLTSEANLWLFTAGLEDGIPVYPDYGLILDSNDKFDLTISKKSCAGLADDPNAIVLEGYGTATLEDYNTTESCHWHWTGDFADGSFGIDLLRGTAQIKITVTGEDIIVPGDWTIDLKLDTNDVPEGIIFDVAKGAVSHEWKLNGSQFIVPYLHTDAAAYGTYVVVTNTSSKDAEISLDVYADKKSQLGIKQDAKACENVVLPKVPANSTATYYPTDLNSAIDETPGCANFSTENDRYMGHFFIIAPNDDIHAVAFQKDGINGKRSIPVLTNETHTWKE